MKKLTLLIIVLLNFSFQLLAQTKTIKMGTTKIEIAGNLVSDIKLLNGLDKVIGNLYTHTSITDTEIIFSQYQHYKDGGIDFVCIQRFTISEIANLIAEIEVKKSFIDPERKTNPKQNWDVTIAFKQKNKDYKTVGTTEEYRLSYLTEKPKTIKENYTGTNRLLPFATKKAADEFVAKVKEALKNK
jgi:signal recognition particle subunit SEC65